MGTTMTTWTTRSATPHSSLSPQVAIRQTSAQLGQCHQLEGKDARAMLTGGASGRATTQHDKDDDVSNRNMLQEQRWNNQDQAVQVYEVEREKETYLLPGTKENPIVQVDDGRNCYPTSFKLLSLALLSKNHEKIPIRDSRLCRLCSDAVSLSNHVPLDDGTHLITMKPTSFYSRVNT